jgi:hypothetical protein
MYPFKSFPTSFLKVVNSFLGRSNFLRLSSKAELFKISLTFFPVDASTSEYEGALVLDE